MTEPSTFHELMRSVRAGDADAATELVRRFEPAIRRILRLRMTDPALRRALDSADICQSVLAQFFVHVGLGDYQVETPEQLVRLLTSMAKNRLFDHVRHEHAERRDRRRVLAGGDSVLERVSGKDSTPSQIVANRDLLKRVSDRLNDQERYLIEQRALGRDWGELATEAGVDANTLRMRLRRALERVLRQMELDGCPH